MLFHCQMEVLLPPDMPPEEVADLRSREKAVAQEFQRQGKWPHLWRVAGRAANISIIDAADADELHAILTALPLFPWLDITVTPLAKHPSAL